MRVPITVDLHVPNFNYPGVGPERVFDTLVDIATTAESSGWSSISLMDHFHQIAPVGPEHHWMFDGNTMLSAIAARTTKLTLGTLVGGVTYRNPAMLAKITTTLDVVSGGRAWLGLGAAWFEGEHQAYGFEFPPLRTRFELLEEALQITRAMFTEERPRFSGAHFRIDAPYNSPRPLRGDIPILIGGSGERKTLRLVARYGDGCNLFVNNDPERLRHLIGVLERHCEEVGRDIGEITITGMGSFIVGDTHEAAQRSAQAAKDAGWPAERIDSCLIGDPDTIGEAATKLRDAGMQGVTVSLANAWELDGLTLLGRTLSAVFGSP